MSFYVRNLFCYDAGEGSQPPLHFFHSPSSTGAGGNLGSKNKQEARNGRIYD